MKIERKKLELQMQGIEKSEHKKERDEITGSNNKNNVDDGSSSSNK